MELYKQISEGNRIKYGTEAEKVLRIIINQYSDRTHFIYEVLQNAEDAGASRISFRLEKDRLLIIHNGRPFNTKDIEGVCGIANGTKEDGTRIGHFGIGFKSVYCYTETPFIYSGEYHFIIKNQLFPEEVSTMPDLADHETCLIIPFNKNEVDSEVAYQEIRNALLRKIKAESILMLNSISDVIIQVQDYSDIIHINKKKYPLDRLYPENVFSLSMNTTIKNTGAGSERSINSDYLFFTDADKEAVNVIFMVEEKEIRPIKNSKIYAFFPTAKEAHQNFYIHAPFDTTPARDNFKEGAEYGKHNVHLVENIGKLIWFAFTWMKDHKYLSVSGFNAVFPIYEYEDDDILYRLYQNSIEMIREEIILPTNTPYEFKKISEVFIPANESIVNSINDEDLRKLLRQRNVNWLAKEFSTNAYADIRSFLNRNFELRELDWKDLVSRFDAIFLKGKSIKWNEDIMGRIENACIRRKFFSGHFIDVSNIPFVRTSQGDQICARDSNGKLQVYLNNPDIAQYKIDVSFRSSEAICSFYKRALLIPEYDIEQEITENILPKYDNEQVMFSTDNHLKENFADLKVIKKALSGNLSIAAQIADKYIVTNGTKWYRPSDVFIKSSDSRSGYSLLEGIVNFNYLSDSYFDYSTAGVSFDPEFFIK